MSNEKVVRVGNTSIGKGEMLAVIAGPCVIESLDHCLMMAERLRDIARRLEIPFVFKSSFDKANRTSIESYRGPGMEKGLEILEKVRTSLGIPVTTDFHIPSQAKEVGETVDLIQVPAFLCRQTDMLVAAGRTGKPVNVKKGQFLAPWDVTNIVEKVHSTGNRRVMLTERGTSFGYNRLVVDMAGIAEMLNYGFPVVFDGTHSVQLPGGMGKSTGGRREMVEPLCLAACAVGVDALFLEVHNDPDKAPSDGPNMVPLDKLEKMLMKCLRTWEAANA